MTQPLSRATSVAELHHRFGGFVTAAGKARRMAFVPRPTDVFVTTFAKCGTTWMQQIVHGLRTRGDMDFREITAVVPWIELAHDLGIDPDAPQKAEPRAFKTHLDAHDVPKGGRYIVVLRDPRDAFLSLFRFLEGWFFEPGAISVATFAREDALVSGGGHNYWHHLASWWPRRLDADVLMLSYEDMKQDLERAVRAVARFIGVALDDALLAIVLHQSSLAFMQAHAGQFDDNLIREKRDAACGLPPGGDSGKVRTGRTGDGRAALPPDIDQAFDQAWSDIIAAPFGLADYEALRAALAAGR